MTAKDMRTVLRSLGLLLPTVGAMALLSLPVALVFGEGDALGPLGLTALISLGMGAALYLPFRRAGEAQLKHGLIIAALGWLLVSALGALPLHLISIGRGLPYKDMASAFFEAVSGFTGTGLTMAARPDLLPRTLQWWRSFMEWIGGMGVIVLMLTILVGPGKSAASLYFAEARGEKIHPSVVSTVRTMWWIFALYTGIAVVAMWAMGMPAWEAVNHAMTGIATGGFSLWPDSIGRYRSLGVELVVMFTMIAGAVSFVVHYHFLREGPKALVNDVQTRWFLVFLLAGAALVGLEALAWVSPGVAFRTGAFQYVSSMTCTGFQTVPLGAWSGSAKLLLTVGMVVGGAAGSTAGGIKVLRMVFLVRGASWQLKRLVQPADAIVPLRLGHEVLPEAVAFRRLSEAALLSFLWILFLLLGTLLFAVLLPAASLTDALFEVASAQGNVGLSGGLTSAGMPTLAKLLLCFHMWIGRLEIIPVLMFLRALSGRREWR